MSVEEAIQIIKRKPEAMILSPGESGLEPSGNGVKEEEDIRERDERYTEGGRWEEVGLAGRLTRSKI